ncbi:leucine rich adaptor protein 1 [Lethenteron reissneri]|uniref:leucine rich adaptor protein 1 n=1 Tax=Lethenteron reissneri TaxID=7753 RepID=UPI002AB6212C|nr:leucine rich adaptor protein 1 [Lethenteron reissneri]
MDEAAPPGVSSQALRELEGRLGRRMPESLARCLPRGEEPPTSSRAAPGDRGPPRRDPLVPEERGPRRDPLGAGKPGASPGRLDELIATLRADMTGLRVLDSRILTQLLAANEGLEALRWLLEDRAGLCEEASSQFSGSLYSLPDESQESGSPRDSWACQPGSDLADNLDRISVGSLLDALADDSSCELSFGSGEQAQWRDAFQQGQRASAVDELSKAPAAGQPGGGGGFLCNGDLVTDARPGVVRSDSLAQSDGAAWPKAIDTNFNIRDYRVLGLKCNGNVHS